MVPPRAVAWKASATSSVLPAASMAKSAPWPPVSDRTSVRTSELAGSSACVAPTVSARSRLLATGSTAMICKAPLSLAAMIALRPTPPAPKISTVDPGVTRARLVTAQ